MKTAGTILALGLSLVTFAQTVPITDPAAFVTEVYRRFNASEHGSDYLPPKKIYTPRLEALFAADDRRRRGEVGCIGFVFWVNGQDWELKDVSVTSRDVPGHPERRLVIATFMSIGTPEEIHFDFQRIGGRWLLDDAQSVKAERWTLSSILKCR
jgi:hypothetical protein